MQTRISPRFQDDPIVAEANAILRTCVHCGFCNATCPTYQILGDELDGPRGRIYLIKEFLAGAPATEHSLQHLDRCLTCRACETTCPSGVRYARLAEIGREHMEAEIGRPALERLKRWRKKFRPCRRPCRLQPGPWCPRPAGSSPSPAVCKV